MIFLSTTIVHTSLLKHPYTKYHLWTLILPTQYVILTHKYGVFLDGFVKSFNVVERKDGRYPFSNKDV